MNFLYPQFNAITHRIKSSADIVTEYPYSQKDLIKDFTGIPDESATNDGLGVGVCVVRENIGYNFSWTLVKITDKAYEKTSFYNKYFYIPTQDLINVGPKITYTPSLENKNLPDKYGFEVNPVLKQIFIPYVDSKNGLYSVRVQIDSDRILDMVLFNKVLEEVFIEGIQILLSSRGFRSDNEYIISIAEKYYTFGYINDDLDLTTRRTCEPLTFTVSMPLSFFDQSTAIKGNSSVKASTYLQFNNREFIEKIDTITNVFTSRSEQISKITYPNKVIKNFVLEFFLNSLARFAITTNELMSSVGYPITPENNDDDENFYEYEIGLDNNYNIVSAKVTTKNYGDEKVDILSQGFISQLRLRGEFNNKNIFYILNNIESLTQEQSNTPIIQFLKKYLPFSDIDLVEETLTINGNEIPAEKLSEYRVSFVNDSEKCVNLSDIMSIVRETTSLVMLADPLYHLFVPNDPKNDTSVQGITEKIKKNFDSIKMHVNDRNKSYRNNPTDNQAGQILLTALDVGGQEISSVFKEQFPVNDINSVLNTLSYVFKRLDLEEIIFKFIFCTLKQSDINDPRIAELLSKIPGEVINYIKHVLSIQNLAGAAYIRALEQGFTFDFTLFCNDELAYLIKGLSKILNGLKVFATKTIRFVNELSNTLSSMANRGYANSYEALIRSVTRTIYTTSINFLFELAQNSLTMECDDLDPENVTDFNDIFGTHYPLDGFGGQQNNNKKILSNNRLKTVKETIPGMIKEMTYGSDTEYTVDLIGLLLKDISCLLTPIESVNLLNGEPSEEVKIIIKNIIISKYSKDPNNLTYLLDDDILVLFFKKLGFTVDPKVKDQITTEYITNYERYEFCKTVPYESREKILSGKLPEELGTLQKDIDRRVKNATKALEYLTSDTPTFPISALCPDVEDDELNLFKEDVISEMTESVKSMFSDTLNMFNDEAEKIYDSYVEEKQFKREDNSGKVFETFKYNTFLTNAGLNFSEQNYAVHTAVLLPDTLEYGIKKKDEYPYYILEESGINKKEIVNKMLGTRNAQEALLTPICQDNKVIADDEFERYLSSGRVFIDYHGTIERDNRIYPELKEQALNRFNTARTKVTYFSEVMDNYVGFNKEIKDKKIKDFLWIYPNLADNSEIERKNYINIYRIGYDRGYYLVGDKYSYEGDKYSSEGAIGNEKDDEDYNKKQERAKKVVNTLTTFYSLLNDKRPINADDYYYKRKNFKFINEETGQIRRNIIQIDKDFILMKDLKDGEVIKGVGIYVDSEDFPPNIIEAKLELPRQTFSVIQEAYNNTKKDLKAANDAEVLMRNLDIFKSNGLFKIVKNYKESEQKVNYTVKVATTDNENTIKYRDIYSVNASYKFDNLNTENNKNIIWNMINGIQNVDVSGSYIKFIKNNTDSAVGQFLNKEFSVSTEDWLKNILDQDYPSESQYFVAYSKDSSYKILRRDDYVDHAAMNYKKFKLLNYSFDYRYKNCNLYPHYLNLDYFLSTVFNKELIKGKGLCDSNINSMPYELLNSVLVNSTIRTHVTDYLIKAAQILTLMSKEQLDNLYKQQFVVDLIREHIKFEMNLYTQELEADSKKQYYTSFIRTAIKDVYSKYENFGSKIKQKFILPTSLRENKEIDYFIRKEIDHFIKFALEKRIIKQTKYDYPILIAKNLDQDAKTYFDHEFWYSMLAYMVMVSTVDQKKKNIFAGTKSELAKLFFSTRRYSGESQEDTDYSYKDVPANDIIKYIRKIAYSPNPAIAITMNPDYGKYVAFLLNALKNEFKSFALNSALTQDNNIMLTRLTGLIASSGLGLTWGLIDPETRQKLMVQAAVNNIPLGLLYKRFEQGLSPLPDFATSLIVTAASKIVPTNIGIAYLALDAVDEAVWLFETIAELEELARAFREAKNIDPCANPEEEIDYDISCNAETKESLITGTNKYEE